MMPILPRCGTALAGMGMAVLVALLPTAPAWAEDLRGREIAPQSELLLFARAPTNPLTGRGDPRCIVEPDGTGLRVTWVQRDAGGFRPVRAERLATPTLVVQRQADVVGRDGTVTWVELAADATVEPLGWGVWPGN